MMRNFNKKGIELTVNFLVTFILAIVIFGLGIILLRGMIGDSESSLEQISGNIDDRIIQLACSSRDRVCISNNEQTVDKGEPVYFGVHINNYLQQKSTFKVTIITPPDAYQGSTKLTAIRTEPLFATEEIIVPAKQQSDEGFAIVVPKETLSGQYFYKVRVESIEHPEDYKAATETLIFTVR